MRTVSFLVLCAAAAPAAAGAAQPSPPAPRAQPGELVEWVLPAVSSAVPLSEKEKEHGRRHGRALPAPEVLQPSLDPALRAFRPAADRSLAGSFKGASSDVLPDLAHRWIEGFRRHYPGVTLSIVPPYAGSLGAQELVKENLDFVLVSRELKPEDIATFQAKFGYAPFSVPISGGSYRHYGFLDAVGFMVHKDNPIEKLTFDQLDAVFSSTRHRGGAPITTWGQLGATGEWTDKPVHPYGIKPWNGFEEFVRQRVLSREDKRGEWRGDVHFDAVVFPVAARVAEDRHGIGYTGLAYLDAGVKVVPLAAGTNGPFVAPTYENVATGSYPLSRLVFFNTNKAPGEPLRPAIAEFVRFILSRDGQEIVRQQGIFLPLRADRAEQSLGLVDP